MYTPKYLLREISLSTCQPCITLDVLIYNNLNNNCLLLVGVFCSSYSQNFQLITIYLLWCYHAKSNNSIADSSCVSWYYICVRSWKFFYNLVEKSFTFVDILKKLSGLVKSEKEQLLNTETSLPY